MPNRSSRADHVPIRTCVVCKKKDEKKKMIRLTISEDDLIYDWQQRLPMRGYYACNVNDCLLLLDKWLKRRKRVKKDKREKKY